MKELQKLGKLSRALKAHMRILKSIGGTHLFPEVLDEYMWMRDQIILIALRLKKNRFEFTENSRKTQQAIIDWRCGMTGANRN